LARELDIAKHVVGYTDDSFVAALLANLLTPESSVFNFERFEEFRLSSRNF
jgi:hypothetical protein